MPKGWIVGWMDAKRMEGEGDEVDIFIINHAPFPLNTYTPTIHQLPPQSPPTTKGTFL